VEVEVAVLSSCCYYHYHAVSRRQQHLDHQVEGAAAVERMTGSDVAIPLAVAVPRSAPRCALRVLAAAPPHSPPYLRALL
jgi:hypothetical protein